MTVVKESNMGDPPDHHQATPVQFPAGLVADPDDKHNNSKTIAKDEQQHMEPTPQDDEAPSPSEPKQPEFLQGWRLHVLTAGIWIALFLSTLETTIVSTSLVSIADALSGFEERNWVVTSYFLTYTGFLVIYAKLASIFGPKTMLLFALTVFMLFSLGCGAASNMTQLIILRAFQGIGGSGIYSMVLALAPTMVPVTEYGKYVAIISSVFAIASFTGPLVGGAIAAKTSWRWVFLLNGPPGLVAILIIAIFLPASKDARNLSFGERLRSKFSRESTRRVDLVGAISLLAASVLLVFALESGGSRYPWNSAAIISTLVLSGLTWIVFIAWEIRLERANTTPEPIFAMGLLKNRQLASMMCTTFLIGFPFVTILFLLPQHAQAVYGVSPVQASLTVLPLLLTSPVATLISGVLTSNFNVPPAHLILVGSAIQLVGVGLAIAIPLSGDSVSAFQYAAEAVMGLGFGMTLATALTLGQFLVAKEEAGVVMGALTQIRVLGGTVALAICSAVMSNHLRESLAGVVTPEEAQEISEALGAMNKLDPERMRLVRLAFAEGYRTQIKILTGFSAAALVAAMGIVSRRPVTAREVARQRGEL